jgi:hypothetical protein
MPMFAPSLDRLVVLRFMLTIPKIEDSAAFFGYRMISKVVTECMNAAGEVGGRSKNAYRAGNVLELIPRRFKKALTCKGNG